MKNLLAKFLAVLAMTFTFAGASAQIAIDFSGSSGTGIATDKVLINNIHVTGSTTGDYNVIFQFDPASFHLIPVAVAGCAAASVQVYNAVLGSSSPIVGATVSVGGQTSTTNASGIATFSGLSAGTNSVSVTAPNFTPTAQQTLLACNANTVTVAMSPAQGQTGGLGAGQFRVVLTWGANPADLDSHLTGPNLDPSRFHVYYSAKTAGGLCGLDVDDTTSFGPETITCPVTGNTSGALRPGVYRYSVHHYSGSGTIATSGATVRLEGGNGAVVNYTPPAGFTGANDVWTVFELTINSDGTAGLTTVNSVTHGISAGSVSRPKAGFLTGGQREDPALFQNLAK
ncbi:MAG TPA: carboxypeptidase regulatory-like domain-containing protein [Ramlibacter sp.]|nr:carboxypeptidase regulatory-like domain-containing protein [Ramlibacter sp.]